ncbi:VOC family protein [Marilutibacter chinensis]|uniref:VOC family protein n=1 Tax=Marilutibacter chinensis TaxID=2912247 RepID=A0ABS9HVV0_9GAMM|nr:VOC family protein [Lysobacter chinensis]MCF7222290.1 VOC family protein [Lysobacter chinensis]
MSTASHAPGSPSWFELATTDQAGAERFYGGLFGWVTDATPMPDGSHYTIFRLDGREVAACYTMLAEQREQGVPPHWSIYFRTDDVDAAVARASAGGGGVVVEAYEVMEHLRMAVLSDPEGAVFSLHQPRSHGGVDAIRQPNAIAWVELATRDLPRAEAFYRDVLGWSLQDHTAAPVGSYRIFCSDDGQVGGLLKMDEDWAEMPSHWSIYVQVEDVDEAVARAEALGGRCVVAAFDIPGVGRIARINDPAGAGFYVIRLGD